MAVTTTSRGDDASEESLDRFCREFDAVFKARGMSLRRAAELSGWGKTTIDSARKGHGLPNRDLVRDVLQAMDLGAQEVDAWVERRDRIASKESAAAGEPEPTSSKRHWLIGAIVAVGVVAGVVIGLLVAQNSDVPEGVDGRAANPPVGSRDIVVQNKVAIGPTALDEDDSPSYLSSRTVSRCANTGCKLGGTDVYSGAKLTAYCQTEGEWLTNADLESDGIKQNPGLVASDIWYGIEWRDGRRGYISEVYIEESYRGGLALPQC